MDEYVFARYLTEEMAARGWRQRDLAEHSGLARQVISTLVTRPLRRMIATDTIAGLAQALALPTQMGVELTDRQQADAERRYGQVVRLKAAEATGDPVGTVVTVVRSPTNEELVELLRTRLGVTPSDAAAAPNAGQAGQVSGEAGTSGDVRDPRRHSRGSDTQHERAAHPDAHPHLI